MYFWIAALIVMAACSAITIKTLIGYNNFCLSGKILVSSAVLIGWFSPFIIGFIRKNNLLEGALYNAVSYAGYYLFGLVFILFILLILRDFIWYVVYGLGKLSGVSGWWLNPKNLSSLGYANLAVVLISVGISVYAVCEAVKTPAIKRVEFSSPLLDSDFHLVQLSDLHINRSASAEHLQKLVETVNSLKPDVILMTGDIVDDHIRYLGRYMDILKNLKAKHGVYFSVGNHETHNGLPSILKKIYVMGFKVLLNRGEKIEGTNVFIAGVPDKYTAAVSDYLSVNFDKAVKGSTDKDYRILLSHNPEMADYAAAASFNLVLAGHTHGGQIFPFHLPVQKANKYLSGTYQVNGSDVYVSRGAGYWGPPMRILAPSEITDIMVKAVKQPNTRYIDDNIQEMRDAQNFGFGL